MTGHPSYSGDRDHHCTKCLWPDADTTYVHGVTHITHHGDDHTLTTTHGAGDALLRRCRRCGYAWLEACRDQPDTLNAGPATAGPGLADLAAATNYVAWPKDAITGARVTLDGDRVRFHNAAGTVVYDSHDDINQDLPGIRAVLDRPCLECHTGIGECDSSDTRCCDTCRHVTAHVKAAA